MFIASGCLASSRTTLLRDYEPSGIKTESLANKKILVIATNTLFDVSKNWETSTSFIPAPEKFSPTPMTKASTDNWDKELNHLKDTQTKKDWLTVGWIRNGFGMHMGDVYSVTKPSEWLAQTLTLDLINNGVVIVRDSSSADLTIDISMVYVKSDTFANHSLKMYVDCVFKKSGQSDKLQRYAVNTVKSSYSTSSYEIFETFRQGWQIMLPSILKDIAEIAP